MVGRYGLGWPGVEEGKGGRSVCCVMECVVGLSLSEVPSCWI